MVLHSNALNHTNTAINSLEFLVSATKDAETGVRGFLLVDDTVFLEPYKNASATIDSLHKTLTDLISNNPVQKKNLEEVMVMIDEELNLLQQLIEHNTIHPNSFIEGDKAAAYRDKVLMEDIRSKIRVMQGIEQDIFKVRKEELERTSNAIEIINYISILLAVILGAYSIITFNKENIAKKKANADASRYRSELEKRVEELKHANEELVNLKSIEKFAATGRIARTIAHEVRNPLTNIGLAAEQLKDDLAGNEDCVMLIDMINRNSTRINQLITDLLNSTKFAQLDFKNVSINTLLDETIEFAKDRLNLNGIKIEKDYADNMRDVLVDNKKLKIAFLNIIVNAIEAMEPGKGLLKIKTEMNKNKCVVTIKDNGKGINEEEMARMFEPYYSSKSKGTGLGLTNTQNIILNHKGSMKVESEVGIGTSFIISFDPA
jgi:signal transduction histidine kinase